MIQELLCVSKEGKISLKNLTMDTFNPVKNLPDAEYGE